MENVQKNRILGHLLVISVQAVDQYRKDPRLNQVVYGRVTVTGQQLPTKTKEHTKDYYSHSFTDTQTRRTNDTQRQTAEECVASSQRKSTKVPSAAPAGNFTLPMTQHQHHTTSVLLEWSQCRVDKNGGKEREKTKKIREMCFMVSAPSCYGAAVPLINPGSDISTLHFASRSILNQWTF